MPYSNQQDSSTLRRIQWVESEWDTIAKEVVRIKPNIINSDTLLDLNRATFLEAQKILPSDRQRNPAGVPNIGIVRPRLLDAIKKLRTQVQAQERIKAAELAARQAEEKAAANEPPPPAPPNPYEVAFAPLVNLIANQVTATIRNDLRELFAQLNPKAAPVEFSSLPDVIGAVRPKIAVVGPLSVQQQDIARAYPQVDFLFFEKGTDATHDRLASSDFIIGMTDFMKHGDEYRITGKYGDKYKRVTGSASAVKRLVGILLNSLAHKPQEVTRKFH